MNSADIAKLVQALSAHESRARSSFNLTPSENVVSPLAKLPFVSDIYSRYFFEHLRLHGAWMFWGGIEAGQLQSSFLEPALQRLTGAQYIETRPLSGLNCMTVVISGLCPPGGTMMTVPVEAGGHMSTSQVAARLGVRTTTMMMTSWSVDLEQFERDLRSSRIDLVYIDQSTQLFPIDARPLRQIIEKVSPDTLLHCDTSHTNGLVLGGVLANPLEQGAHTFGGSTHKTLPGPHKAFVATNDSVLADSIGAAAFDLISHHQVAASVSLAITLDEFEHRDGVGYARQVLANAKVIAATLAEGGLHIGGADNGWTDCHQVWASPSVGVDPDMTAAALYDIGLLVNILPGLPSMPGKSLRLSSAELTRLGAREDDAAIVAGVLCEALHGHTVSDRSRQAIRDLRARLDGPRYCYEADDIAKLAMCPPLRSLADALSM